MDVTQEVRKNHIIYGASDYTASHSLAASNSLNYAEGPSITRPAHQECSVIPYTFRYEDAVGLFGAENYFTRIKLNIVGDVVFACFEEEDWECGNVSRTATDSDAYYEAALVESDGCVDDPTGYYCADLKGNSLPEFDFQAFVKISLENLKTGNMYVDDWVDVRLYTKNKEEHPYDTMWVKPNDYFYLGIHARNTKRLPFNVACVIGKEYTTLDNIPNKYEIMKR